MRECHKDILQRLILVLLRDLEPKPLLDYLFSKKEIDEDDMDEIKSCKVRKNISEALIFKLMKKGPQAFSNLVDGLQNKQPSLACSLLQEENKRLSRLEIELENLKIETEERKTKLQRFEESEPLQNKRLSELEIKLESLKIETEELKTKLHCFEEKKRLRPLSSLESSMDDFEEPFDDSSGRQSRRVECERTSRRQRSRTSTRLRNESSQSKEWPLSSLESSMDDFEEPFDDSSGRQSRRMECERTSRCQRSRTSTRLRKESSRSKEYHFRYEGDFDTKGVIHYLGFEAGVSIWRNPARVPSPRVKVTYCEDDDGRGDPENILEYFNPSNSSARSGWCLDLGDYTLRLTDYTVRQLGSNDKYFLQNFEIHGKLCADDDWFLVGRHDQVDWRSQCFSHMMSGNKDLSYKTKTWPVEGETRAYRQFKIVPIKDRSTSKPGAHAMSLAGIELYGVLSVP